MRHETIINRHAQGADLRSLRRARGLTLEQLAERLGRSTGWLSQVERDLSNPSVDDLKGFSEALDAPLSMLLSQGAGSDAEAGVIVRNGHRRRIGERVAGLTEELLSPDLTDDFEVVHSTFAPRTARRETVTRPTQELGIVIAGRLDLVIGGTGYTVGTGDSFRIRDAGFSWANPYDQPAVVIWVIAPPVY